MLDSSLINLQALRTATLLKRDSNTNFFSVKFAMFLRTPCFTEHLQVSASDSFRFPVCNFIKKEIPAKVFFCEFCKIFKNIFSFDGTPPNDCFLSLSVSFEKFSRTLLLQSSFPQGNCLFHVHVAEFQPPDTVKNYFTGSFQAFSSRTKSSHSKAFINLKSLKTICEEVNL